MTDFETQLRDLSPAKPDVADALRAAYEAGVRDASSTTGRWRLAAGVLLAATLGLAASAIIPVAPPARIANAPVETETSLPVVAEQRRPAPATAHRVTAPRPESYAAIRQQWSATGELVLPTSNSPGAGGVHVEQTIYRVGDAL